MKPQSHCVACALCSHPVGMRRRFAGRWAAADFPYCEGAGRMLITPAYAQAAGGGDTSSMMVQLAPLALIFVVFYFFLIRPQQQKAKQQRAMLDAVRRGDRVVTAGGLIGTIAKVVSNEEVLV